MDAGGVTGKAMVTIKTEIASLKKEVEEAQSEMEVVSEVEKEEKTLEEEMEDNCVVLEVFQGLSTSPMVTLPLWPGLAKVQRKRLILYQFICRSRS